MNYQGWREATSEEADIIRRTISNTKGNSSIITDIVLLAAFIGFAVYAFIALQGTTLGIIIALAAVLMMLRLLGKFIFRFNKSKGNNIFIYETEIAAKCVIRSINAHPRYQVVQPENPCKLDNCIVRTPKSGTFHYFVVEIPDSKKIRAKGIIVDEKFYNSLCEGNTVKVVRFGNSFADYNLHILSES